MLSSLGKNVIICVACFAALGCNNQKQKILGIWQSPLTKFHAYEFRPNGKLLDHWFERTDLITYDADGNILSVDKATNPGKGLWKTSSGSYELKGDNLTLYTYDPTYGTTLRATITSLSATSLVMRYRGEDSTYQKIKALPESTLVEAVRE